MTTSAAPLVAPLAVRTGAGLAELGGKGASLARLAAAGLPVPPGFHVTTEAYRRFTAGALQDAILAEVGERGPEAAPRIAHLFAEAPIPPEIAAAIRSAYGELGAVAVAVRSSATAEDLPGMSFAGQQDSFLNVRGADAVVEAVRRCWASLWNARAIAYRERNGVAQGDVTLAVVVQELVDADAAGVLFTADPATGARDRTVVNASWGLGEAVVGGQVTPDSVALTRRDGGAWEVAERRTADKAVMTVRTPDGTREVPVPEELRRVAVLDDAAAGELARIGERIEELYGTPMDVEWARQDGATYVVQARPVTASATAYETWNDSLAGDYLWTNANLGEAIPSVMTPCTWSLVKAFMGEAMATASLPGYRAYGSVGGRFYMNLSLSYTLAATVGVSMARFVDLTEEVFGRLPDGVTIPRVPLSRWRVLRGITPVAIRTLRTVRADKKHIAAFVAAGPDRCADLRGRVAAADAAGLVRLWRAEIEPYFHLCSRMLSAAGRQDGAALVTVRKKLRAMVGDADANALFTGLAGGGGLASLGPLRALEELAAGEIDRAAFARTYGHRGPDEFEVSLPRPAEDPEWLDRQLAGVRSGTRGTGALLARQEEARAAAWRRFDARYPRKAAATRARLDRWANAARGREEVRSEVVRCFWVLRDVVRRAGELTGRGDDLFFLSIDEVVDVLGGAESALGKVGVRRATYERYRALPPYPTLIRGRFDPFRWAADPDRRADLYDAHATRPASATVTGFPGAAGVVEGVARVIGDVSDGGRLAEGDILVTTVTNIGWTPLFPRAAAVVTDIGAPLSHAAIVARELGIPAVVGCGNATMRITDGDRLRVDGAAGTVDILAAEA
ncbi:MAG TPA: PEP/pyruvate-binding domain-containing protein [Streptosporangiaceae bacterium]|jgi:pyruvate,water dikinase